MKPFNKFCNMEAPFWALIKFISETLGYTERRMGIVKTYKKAEIEKLCKEYNINVTADTIENALDYTQMRAELLNEFAKVMLMDAEAASEEYRNWELIHRTENYYCKLPLNKQKGKMKQVAFFTAIINTIAEKTIREFNELTGSPGFDDDPRGLTYIGMSKDI